MLIERENFKLKSKGLFIVLEGVNGAGKSSLIPALKNYLSTYAQVLTTFEPGATPTGAAIRKIVLESQNKINSIAELFLFAADRAEHVATVIRAAIAEQKIVISDRYYYSTLAFQGYGRGMDLKLIEDINRTAINGTVPDLTVLLDLDPKAGLDRAGTRAASADSFEREKLEFHTKVRDGFLEIASTSADPFLVIDASKPKAEVQAEVLDLFQKFLKIG